MMGSGSNLHKLRQAAQMSQWKAARRKLTNTNRSRQPCLYYSSITITDSTVMTRTTIMYSDITEKFHTRNSTLDMTTETDLDSSLYFPFKT